MKARLLVLVLVVGVSACTSEKANPTSPDRYDSSPLNGPVTLRGFVRATNGGQMLPNVYFDVNGRVFATDANGGFVVDTPAINPLRLSFSGAGIIPRTVNVAADRSHTVAVDAIVASGFDLAYYQQMVRNATETGVGGLLPLQRWTKAPSIYLKTVDESGAPIDAQTLTVTEATIRETLPIWTADHFAAATIERGTADRLYKAGWITVRWPASAPTDRCGQAQVAQDGGFVELFYKGATCSCAGVSAIKMRTVRHELGHAMGFWHTTDRADVMFKNGSSACDALPSPREQMVASIAYSRPVGNMDPDVDPASALSLVAPRAVLVP